jgi:hypothetical protein
VTPRRQPTTLSTTDNTEAQREPRILLFDIETAPLAAWVFEIWHTNVHNIEAEWYILSVAWKWVGDRETHVAILPDFPKRWRKDRTDDYELALLLHKLFDEADVIVGHNSIAFDTKKAQARMLVHGLQPPSPYKEVDTFRVAKAHFGFTRNRLDDLCQQLGVGKKLDTGGFETWRKCMDGDAKAWARMRRYNAHDVKLLEGLYLKIRPWMPRHPNLGAIANRPNMCPNCGAEGTMQSRGWELTSTRRYRRFQCRSCGHRCSERTGKPRDTTASLQDIPTRPKLCVECGGKNTFVADSRSYTTGGPRRRFKCKACGHSEQEPSGLPLGIRKKNIPDRPNVCPVCLVTGKMITQGWQVNVKTRRRRFHCTACGHSTYGPKLEKTENTYV